MLQHEPAPQALSLPVSSFRETPVTPGELAQAIVTLEDRQEDPAHTVNSMVAIQPILENGGFDFTPGQVLAEIQQQRVALHQNMVMTPRKRRHAASWHVAFWLVLSGGIIAAAAILFLLFTTYQLAGNFAAASQALAVSKAQLASNALAASKVPLAFTGPTADAQQLLLEWTYPGANADLHSLGTHLSSGIMTTGDKYAAVWKHYAQQVGNTQLMPGHALQANTTGTVPDLTEKGTFFDGTQTANYKVMSISTPDGQMTTFLKYTSRYTLTLTIHAGGGQNKTTITEVVTTP